MLKFKLHEKQIEIFQHPARFKVVAAGRRGGKTFLSAVTLLTEALRDENHAGFPLKNMDVWYVAPTFQQAKDIMWNLLKELGKDVIVSTHENTATATLINGRRICLKGSDRPDTLRGVGISYLVIDEYATMKPEVWDIIIQPTLADVEGNAMFIGTPEGKNHFYDLWLSAGSDKEGWEDWEAFHFCSLDNPMISRKEIERARNTMSVQAFKQEFEASFAIGGSGAFKEEDVVIVDEPPTTRGTVYMTVDPSGFEEEGKSAMLKNKRLDDTAICIAEVSPQGWYVKEIIYGRWSVRETSVRILNAYREHQPVALGIEKGIARDAIMPYLTDQSRRLGVYPNYAELSHKNNRKTDRVMWALQGRLQHKRIKLQRGAWNRKLIEQLVDFPNDRAHDDLVDALAYIDQISEVNYNDEGVFEMEGTDPFDDDAGY